MIEIDRTIISQYANSATLVQLIHNLDAYIDPRTDIDQFYSFVWNVDTAQGFGLDIWGRIVNIGRDLYLPEVDWLGFSEALPGSFPFDEQPFFDGGGSTNVFALADDAYRKLILTKALANIISTNAPSMNQLLQNLFADRGRCYVNDMGGMAMRYTFEFDLTPVEYAIVTQSGALPRPAGVLLYGFSSMLPLFGFSEAGESASPFDEGVFMPASAYYAII
jgi:hypothetical protein